CMEEVTVRDPGAQRLAEPLARRPPPIGPDPALLLAAAPAETARDWLVRQGVPLDGTPLIGFTSRRWSPPRARLIPHRVRARLPWPPAPQPDARRLVVLLARVLDEIAAKRGAHVLFLPSYNVVHEGDDRVCSAVRDAMTSRPGPILRIDEPALYKGVAAQLDVVFSGRMHPTIFAASEGTPVVGLAYSPKFHGFFELLGRRDRVMDVESFVHETRVGELVAMIDRAFGASAGLADRVQALREETRVFLRRVAEGPA
ncbi:MAG: polysaccharide pyruvyl transferase family protein, partial [Proteobacteria bacterium]|nr:polysaccharide pyruvyl transferase family protein [Pseudomonadota bacterium]